MYTAHPSRLWRSTLAKSKTSRSTALITVRNVSPARERVDMLGDVQVSQQDQNGNDTFHGAKPVMSIIR